MHLTNRIVQKTIVTMATCNYIYLYFSFLLYMTTIVEGDSKKAVIVVL